MNELEAMTVREALKRWPEISTEGARFALARMDDNPIIEITHDEGSYFDVKLSSGITFIRHGNTYVYPTVKPFREPRTGAPDNPISRLLAERRNLQTQIDAALATYELYRTGKMSMGAAINQMEWQLKGEPK